jgi:RNA polymerase sigma factor (sigma-70 family)
MNFPRGLRDYNGETSKEIRQLRSKDEIHNELLALRCRQGRRDALEELVRTWERPLYYYLRRLVDSEQEARQVLQETWIKVLRGPPRLRRPERLPVWLYSIARKAAMSYLRSKYAEQALLIQEGNVPDVSGNSDPSFDNAEQIHYGLSCLSLSHREVLTLFFLQDLPLEEIASVLEVKYRLADLAEKVGAKQ